MAQYFQIHPVNPQLRLIRQAVEILRDGGVVVYPTDSAYALGCNIGEKGALERIRRIRDLDDKHNFTLVCRDLSEISTYAKVGNTAYRLLKALTRAPIPSFSRLPRRCRGVCNTPNARPLVFGFRKIRLPWRCLASWVVPS